MAAVRRLAVLVCVLGLSAGVAAAANPNLTYLQKTLKADMVKTFKKQAPSLTLTSVTCKLPTDGATAHCKAFFTVSRTKGYYPVTARLQDLGGKLNWVAQSPKCWNAAKKRYGSCS